MVLHYAHLCAAAGGVDAFLIGTEMRGLTTIRSSASSYPAVQAYRDLLADVRSTLGSGTKIGYAADWSEYFGHQPGDGSGDVFFHLDPLWADPEIDFVGIDNYMPLSDWRDGFEHADAQEGWPAIYDRAYLQANIAGGEGFDWFYASAADRFAQVRTPITDGAASKPWVFRYKDLRAWWSNAHYDRPGGVESGTPTAWVPQSKPIWFTELGCPGDGICSRDAACARGSGRQPHHEGRWRGRSGDTGCCRGGGCAERPGRDPERDPAARAVPRHASLGVHCRGAWRHRGHDLRPAR
ncbi:GTA TIM-barrel-like domain-containing protein [Primorskyibacter flagellatus]|uniref:GTA TIM-barrel-like domain-containing protein n=1 Tax=Primorskyibacter flagellatus TaxID=1387277 RepID=A0A1W2DVM2_9RHOB|nr:GTA TIM-barrel-like domain-containing protein [Primorskyibacter flagellatus]